MTDPYSVETFASGSASNLKFSPSFAQKSLCDCAVSTLTPRITAPAPSYFAKSRWKLCASMVQPLEILRIKIEDYPFAAIIFKAHLRALACRKTKIRGRFTDFGLLLRFCSLHQTQCSEYGDCR